MVLRSVALRHVGSAGLMEVSGLKTFNGSSLLVCKHLAARPWRLTGRSASRRRGLRPVSLFGFGKRKKRKPDEEIGKESTKGETDERSKPPEVIPGGADVDATQAPLGSASVSSQPNEMDGSASGLKDKQDTSISKGNGNEPQASAGTLDRQWWSDIPYVCVLTLKSCGGLFMLGSGEGDEQELYIVAFEDPQDGHIVKTSLSRGSGLRLNPFGQSREQHFKKLGIIPGDPSEWKSMVEMTWLSPEEFEAILNKTRIEGRVVPAGALADVDYNFKNLEILVDKVKKAIMDKTPQKPVVQPLLNIDQALGTDNMPQAEEAVKSNFAGSSLGIEQAGDVSGVSTDVDAEFNFNDVEEPPLGMGNGYPGRQQVDVGAEFEPQSSIFSSEKEDIMEEKQEEKTPPSISRSPFSASETWWMKLTQLYIPHVKEEGKRGGAVEMNFAVIPDYTDYRPVLFEDMEDAQQFLGVMGHILGKGTMVRVSTQTPEEVMSSNDEDKLKHVVVLAKGTLKLAQEMTYERVVGAIRFATKVSFKEHGVTEEENIPDDVAKGVDNAEEYDTQLKGAAEGMIATLEEAIKDANKYQDKDDRQTPRSKPLQEIAREDEEFSDALDSLVKESLSRMRSTPGDLRTEEKSIKYPSAENTNGGSVAGISSASSGKPVHHQEEREETTADVVSNGASKSRNGATQIGPNSEVTSNSGDSNNATKEVGDDGLEIIYPPGWSEDSRKEPEGPTWFQKLPVVYMPRYVDELGEDVLLAFYHGEEKKPLVLGFQDKHDARHCAEVIGLWEEQGGRPTNVVPLPPDALLQWCKNASPPVDPVILRQGSMPLKLGMDKEEFVNLVGMFGMVQRGDFSGLQ